MSLPAACQHPPRVNRRGGFGWKRDSHHHGIPTKVFDVTHHVAHATVSSVDLRPFCPPVYQQSSLGACTAHAINAAYQFDMIKQQKQATPGTTHMTPFMPSRLFTYYRERSIEGTISQDAGAEIKDGVASLADKGVPPETYWPYDITKFAQQPPDVAYGQAYHNKSINYHLVQQNLNQWKQCLLNGFPIIFGFSVMNEFEGDQVASTGMVPMPTPGEQPIGGHAVLCVGYNDALECFLVRNSWGSKDTDGTVWGIDGSGYFWIPYNYVMDPNLASDFWVITTVRDA